ncbi:hypothetical protein BH18THE2_BH18THE2_24580 [soil metagenome]
MGLPIAPKETISLLKRENSIVEYLYAPQTRHFLSVEQFYEDFGPVSEIEVRDLVAREITTNNIDPNHKGNLLLFS